MPNGRLLQEAGVQAVIRGLGSFKAGAREMDQAIAGIGDSALHAQKPVGGLQRHLDSLAESAGAATIAFGGMSAAGTALIAKTALLAARNEELDIVLETVGKTAGWSMEQLKAEEERIKGLGITTQQARQSLILFMQGQLDIADAAKLARTAQDLAVIGMKDSSAAFTDLTEAILTQRSIRLREYGITLTLTQIYEQYAKEVLAAGAAVKTTTVDHSEAMGTLARDMEILRGEIQLHNEELALQIGYWGESDNRVRRHQLQIDKMNQRLAKMTARYEELGGEHGRVIELKQDLVKELTDEQKKQAFLYAIMKEGEKVAGVYEAAMTKVGKQIRSLPRYFEELAFSIGEYFLEPLGMGVTLLTNFLKWLTKLPPETKKLVASFVMMGTTSTGALAGVAGMIKMLPILSGAMTFLLNPIGLLIAAVGALAGAFIMDVGGIRTKTMPIIMELVETLKDRFLPTILNIVEAIRALISGEANQALMAFAANIVAAMEETVLPVIERLREVIDFVMKFVTAVVLTAWTTIREWTEKNWSTIQAAIETVLDWIGSFIRLAMKNISRIIGNTWAIIREWTEENWPLIQATIETVMETILNIISWVAHLITQFWTRWGQDLLSIAQTAWDIIRTAIETIIRAILGIIKVVMLLIQRDWEGAWDEVRNIARTVWDGIVEIINLALGKIRELIPRFVEAGKDLMRGILRGMKRMKKRIIDWIKGLLRSMVNRIKEFFNIGSPSRLMEGYGREIMAGFIKGLEQMRPALESQLQMTLSPVMQVAAPQAAASPVLVRGGHTFNYNLSANYAQVQSPASIMDDLVAMEMLAGARG